MKDDPTIVDEDPFSDRYEAFLFPHVLRLAISLVLCLGPIGSVYAQSGSDLPVVIGNCESFQGDINRTLDSLDLKPTEFLQQTHFVMEENGKVALDFDYWLSEDVGKGYEFFEGVKHTHTVWAIQEYRPIIDLFLRSAFSQIDDLDYVDGLGPELINDIEVTVNLTPILTLLSLSMPDYAADHGLEVVEKTLINMGRTLPEDTFLQHENFKYVRDTFRNYYIGRPLGTNGVDVLTLEEKDTRMIEIQSINQENWDSLMRISNVPIEVADFMREVGYSVDFLPIEDLRENIIGEVDLEDKKIIVGYDATSQSVNLAVPHHEVGHALRYVINNQLKGYWKYIDGNGEVFTDFDLALASQISNFVENREGDYSVFNDILMSTLLGSNPEHTRLQIYFTKSFSYWNILGGNSSSLDDPEVLSVRTFTSDSGSSLGVISEYDATLRTHINMLCMFSDPALVPENFKSLYSFGLIKNAIKDLKGSR